MTTNRNYEKIIREAVALAFAIDRLLPISVKPRGYGRSMPDIILDRMEREENQKDYDELLCRCRFIEIEIPRHFTALPSPKQADFWYEVMTDWLAILPPKERLALVLNSKKVPMKRACAIFEKEFGFYPHRKSVYNWARDAVDRIKCHLWQKGLRRI